VIHIVLAVILLTITVSCLTEEWFVLLWLLFLLTITVFMFDRGVVHIVVAGYNVDQHCFMFDIGVVHIVLAGYIVDHYIWGLTEEWFILLWLTIILTIYV
jgi:hypothetical protein